MTARLAAPAPVTRQLAAFAGTFDFSGHDAVRRESSRAFLNWLGCAFGGCHEPAVRKALAATVGAGSLPQASVIGDATRISIGDAALINCLSSSVLAFDDTHLATVTHPSGPVAAAILALAETRVVSGADFLDALAVGIEVQCRLSNALILPPARSNIGLYVTGITGPVGAAAAVGRLLHLDPTQLACALGLAAAQSSGFRATHGTMAGALVPALGARSGLSAALLAEQGFTCAADAIEGDKGFLDIFAQGADGEVALNSIGTRFELFANAYKPYPCGIVIHPVIDACLDIFERAQSPEMIENVTLTVNPVALQLTDRRSPRDVFEAQVSIYHWAAAALLRGRAGLEEAGQAAIDDPAIVALRQRIEVRGVGSIRREEAVAEVAFTGAGTLRSHIEHARGSVARPMSDAELDDKFLGQAGATLGRERAAQLRDACRWIEASGNVASTIGAVLSVNREGQ